MTCTAADYEDIWRGRNLLTLGLSGQEAAAIRPTSTRSSTDR